MKKYSAILLLWFISGCIGTDIVEDPMSPSPNPNPSDSSDTREGRFQERPGSGYHVSGTATLYKLEDGQLELALGADFTTSNGPGLVVVLSEINAVNSNSLTLADLESFSGAQTYDVPSDVEISTYNWVIIHCQPFNVTFGYAQLQ